MDKERIMNAVREILIGIGEDPNREGLLDTPRRVADMYEEIFAGINKEPTEHIKLFTTDSEEMVIVKDIPLYSVCEHHILPFVGKAHIAYIPKGNKVLGLSKLARIVDCYAKRPQLQERLTGQIADFLINSISCRGVAVIIEAEHMCMTMRGIKASGSNTRTCALRGCIKDDAKIRSEALELLIGK